jgi:hypothetical protein
LIKLGGAFPNGFFNFINGLFFKGRVCVQNNVIHHIPVFIFYYLIDCQPLIHRVEQAMIVSLTFAQRLLRLLALGDIAGDADYF